MSNVITENPDAWSVIGNIVPGEVSSPTNTSPFTSHNETLTIESAVLVDGHLLIPVKSTASF